MFGSQRASGNGDKRAARMGVAMVTVAGLVVGLSTVRPERAGAGRDAARRAKQVAFTTASGPPVSFAPACDSSGACLVPVSGGPESKVTGSFRGSGAYAGVARLLGSDEAISSAMATFAGTVKGCGRGTGTIRYDAHYGADLPHGGGGTWELVAGLGTGDLHDLTGHGTFIVGTTNADLSGTNEFKGEIRC